MPEKYNSKCDIGELSDLKGFPTTNKGLTKKPLIPTIWKSIKLFYPYWKWSIPLESKFELGYDCVYATKNGDVSLHIDNNIICAEWSDQDLSRNERMELNKNWFC